MAERAGGSPPMRLFFGCGNRLVAEPGRSESAIAMAKNKYVYGMADAAVIVHSGNHGGTWSGALENLKPDLC